MLRRGAQVWVTACATFHVCAALQSPRQLAYDALILTCMASRLRASTAEGNSALSGAYLVLSTGSSRHSAVTRSSSAAVRTLTLPPRE